MRLYSKLLVVGWSVAFNVFFRSFFRDAYSFFKAKIGDFLDLEGCLALKVFFNSFGCSNINYQFNNLPFSDFSFSFSLSTPLVELELLDFCFFIGSNIRVEAPLLNYRLRKSFLASMGNFLCFSFGLSLDSISFPVYSLGNSFFSLKLFSEGRSVFFSNFLLRGRILSFKFFNFNYGFFRNSCFFVGSSLLFHRFDVSLIFEIFGFLSANSFIHTVFNLHVVSGFLGRISAFDLGLVGEIFQMQLDVSNFSFDAFVYFLGTDETSLAFPWSSKSFLVYQGNFYSNSVFFDFLNLLFPVSLYTERVGSFLNVQGLLRVTTKVVDSAVAYTD